MSLFGIHCALAQTEDALESQATLWSFVAVPAADAAAIATDSRWITDGKSRFCFTPALADEVATAAGQELTVTAGLRFTVPENTAGNLRIGGETKSLWLGDQCTMIIPDRKKGEWVKVE